MICSCFSSFACSHVEDDDPDVCSVCRAGADYDCPYEDDPDLTCEECEVLQ